MATLSDVNEKIALAVTAIEGDDHATALKYLRSAKALLVALPSRSAKEGQEVEMKAETIDSLIADIRAARGGSLGVRGTEVVYKNTPPIDDF